MRASGIDRKGRSWRRDPDRGRPEEAGSPSDGTGQEAPDLKGDREQDPGRISQAFKRPTGDRIPDRPQLHSFRETDRPTDRKA